MNTGYRALLLSWGVLWVGWGCQTFQPPAKLPEKHLRTAGQLAVYTNFPLHPEERLLKELTTLRQDIRSELELELSVEPIHVYLFETPGEYRQFMQLFYPELPQRRAFFSQSRSRLVVYAHLNDLLAEDLRHEVTHGYLHSAIPQIPLWLDEGLAEHYEVPRHLAGLHRGHLELLLRQWTAGQWHPNLARLERLSDLNQMTQLDYAESWAWVHWMLHSDANHRKALLVYLQNLNRQEPTGQLENELLRYHPRLDVALQTHLHRLARESRREPLRSR